MSHLVDEMKHLLSLWLGFTWPGKVGIIALAVFGFSGFAGFIWAFCRFVDVLGDFLRLHFGSAV